MARIRSKHPKPDRAAKAHDHKDQPALLRPDVGIQALFKKKEEPATYPYDRSLDPQLSWDINADREHAESLIEKILAATSLEEARQAAWDNLKRELRGVYADSVWEHLAGTVSEPLAAGEHRQIAVKVIDDRGHERRVVRKLSEAEAGKC